MKNHNIGLLGGGMEQAALANRLAEDGGREDLYVVTCFSDRDKLLRLVKREEE